MNKLFIIGNGFDLAHNLPTRYSDFLFWYLREYLKKCFQKNAFGESELFDFNKQFRRTNMKGQEEIVFENILDWDYGFHRLYVFKNLNADEINYQINTPEEVNPIINTGNFIEFLKLFEFKVIGIHSLIHEILMESIDNKNTNWVDIEATYYRLLIEYKSDENAKEKVKELNIAFEKVKMQLIEYLKSDAIPNVSRISSINDILVNEMSSSSKRNEALMNYKKSPQYFRDQSSIKDKWKENLKMDNILFASFNYTDTLTRLYDQEINNINALHVETINIHGTLQETATPEKIIFGYGDEIDEHYKAIENLNENEFLKNIKSFGYYHSNNYKTLLRFIEAEEFEIHLMGHSCGLSDRVLLNTVFEHDNCKNIKIYYHLQQNGNNDYTQKTMNISRHFNDKAKMRARIAPITECKPL